MVGSFNWLAQETQPDLAMITSIIAKYQHCPSLGHFGTARHVLKYINGTKHLGIVFSSEQYFSIQLFVNFSIKGKVHLSPAADTNWIPQDQSIPTTNTHPDLDLFKTKSILGYLLAFHGPFHWLSKRQSITACGLAEAEIYATDRCVHDVQLIFNIIRDLHLQHKILSQPVRLFNDNMVCVLWSKSKTSKYLCHVQIKENVVRESISTWQVEICHIPGNKNLSDIFTKEDHGAHNFLHLQNMILSPPFSDNKK